MKLRDEIEWYRKVFPKYDHILYISPDEYICCVAGIEDFAKVIEELGLMDTEISHTVSSGIPEKQVRYIIKKWVRKK